ncbi:STAS domain-containing protein [Phocicoccus pinnipedialis]|uniref:Anti-sigma factor antagonist n=1 Tax=Phocicoccus pinnipedialis TaxID=110845 RepID=A0A6V7R5I3_9BACL|nr:STAS domain-containing protein [Jeotgalicoccus pinnipedialis]MBP1939910.1 anti-sigma B factor antagonist [Jeotgalicoccus pinnipedialis]CAD2072142.1 Anti-sigma-B factor antagonist [Jeotgalicoccus pinnipedialis]
MNIKINVDEKPEVTHVSIAGELDIYTAPELKKVFEPVATDGTKNLHVDLKGLSYMDSTGLGLFVGTLKDLNKNDKELRVTNVQPRIMKLFEITGLRDLMYITKYPEGEEIEK